MSNLAGKAYAMNVVTPMPRWHWWVKSLIFITVRAIPSLMDGLRGLSFIHFARWVVLRSDQWPDLGQPRPRRLHFNYTLFCSNFNGTWDQYIDAFSDAIPVMLDLAWFGDFDYPHSIPLEKFRRYIHHNQINTDYYYNATPGASEREVKAALRVWREVRALEAAHATAPPEAFARLYADALCRVQNDLGAQGMAPVASLDTLAAARIRQPQIEAHTGAGQKAADRA
ncbi:hypothetical protein [Tabrizicola sp.]|uniref:hypothetical protein n=1 Tax=Tabrizicola sp. TaxID=2005166 RepID=UPI002628627F|nr:hypothetical protein [Tabrizicola sp.]MDM7932481.1 hypothetical protein [Tabrizicola sp.]